MTNKAGAIIVRKTDGEPEVLLIYRAFRDDWSFPKGHIEAGEEAETAMRREVKEETGLDIDVIKQLPEMRYVTPIGEQVTAATYLITPSNPAQNARPEYDQDKISWTPLSQVEELLTYDNLKAYFRSVAADIKQL
jgi:8-oxo-dGTP diphosphatase